MHWSLKLALELIEKNSREEEIVCSLNISPSGFSHVGNLREIVMTYLVTKAIKNLGKNVRWVVNWNDYEPFVKIPDEIPRSYSSYIGMAYSNIPDPCGCHESYAEHYIAEVKNILSNFNLDIEYIHQSEEYKKGIYTDYIREVILNQNQAKDIYATGAYPINLYCRSCGKNDAFSIEYDELLDSIEYRCRCGHIENADVEGMSEISLEPKFHMAMRWKHQNVQFEMGGRKNSLRSENLIESKYISENFFKYQPPRIEFYEFVKIECEALKKSDANRLSPILEELLNIYSFEMILYLFARHNPYEVVNISFDEEVIKLYSDFERDYSRFSLGESLDPIATGLMMLLGTLNLSGNEQPKFNMLVYTLPLVNYEIDLLHDICSKYYSLDRKSFYEKANRARALIKEKMKDKQISFRRNFNSQLYSSLNEVEKNWVKEFRRLLDKRLENSDLFLINIYNIFSCESPSKTKKMQKRFFEIIYQMLLGQKTGPNICILLDIFGLENTIKLLTPKRYVYVEGKVS